MTTDLNQPEQIAPRVKTRIFLVDDHAMFREGLRQLIDREPDFVVSDDAADVKEALKAINDSLPDLVITDIWHPEIDAEMVQSATDAKVIRIVAKNVQEAFDAWNDVKAGIMH